MAKKATSRLDQVMFGWQQPPVQVDQVVGQVDFFHGPRVADGVPVALVKLRGTASAGA